MSESSSTPAELDASATLEESAAAGTNSALEEQSRRSMAYLVASVAGGNLASTAMRMAGGVLVGRLVVPSTLGLFNGMGLVLGYAPLLQLGILNGLNRELPYYVGTGDRRHARDLAAAAQAWALCVGVAVSLALVGLAGWHLVQGDGERAVGWVTYAFLVLAMFYGTNYLQTTYRTSHDFTRLSVAGVIESAVALALLVVVGLLSFYGLCVRAAITAAVSTAILFRWRPVRVGPKWNTRHLKHLLIIGAPIFGAGQLHTGWILINSTLVLRLLGTEGMGLYSMVLVAGTALATVSTALGQVVYPRMAEQYGRDPNPRSLVGMALKPMIATAVGLAVIVAVAWWLVGPTVRLVIPAYEGAIPAMQWALLVPIVMSFQPMASIFNVVRRQDLFVASLLIGMSTYGLSLFFITRDAILLESFSQAMLVGRIFYMASMYIFVYFLLRRGNG